MATVRSRKSRGMTAQRLVGGYLRGLFPFLVEAAAGNAGADLLNTPGLAVEIKARRAFDPMAWLRQAIKNAKSEEIPVVVWQPDGYGPGRLDDWPVMTRLRDFRALYAELQVLRAWVRENEPHLVANLLKVRDELLKEEEA